MPRVDQIQVVGGITARMVVATTRAAAMGTATTIGITATTTSGVEAQAEEQLVGQGSALPSRKETARMVATANSSMAMPGRVLNQTIMAAEATSKGQERVAVRAGTCKTVTVSSNNSRIHRQISWQK